MRMTGPGTAMLAAALMAPVAARASDHEAKDARRFAKRFHEVVQPIQYDGDYAPPAGRPAEPAPSATTPVRFVPAWERAIPVVVPPAPRYVDAAPTRADAGASTSDRPAGFGTPNAAPTVDATGQGQQQATPAGAVPTTDPGALPPLQTGAGSPTGATAYPSYATPLPTPSTPR